MFPAAFQKQEGGRRFRPPSSWSLLSLWALALAQPHDSPAAALGLGQSTDISYLNLHTIYGPI